MMEMRVISFLPLVAAAALLACAPVEKEIDGLLISNVNIVDVEAKEIYQNQSVLIREGRIEQIGPDIEASSYDLFDGRGAYAVAGLYDAHAHIDTASRLELMLPGVFGAPVSASEIDDDLVPYMAYGVTGMIVYNGNDDILAARARANQEGVFTPRILTAGPILDGPGSHNPVHLKIETPEEGVVAVNEAAEKGYDFIKVYHLESVEARNAIIARAGELGLPVMGHLPPGMSFGDSIVPGLANIAHGEEITRPWDGEDRAFLSGAIELMAKHDVGLTPNLVAYREISEEISDIDAKLASLDWELTPPLPRVYATPPFNGYVEDFGGDDIRERAAAYFSRIADAMEALTLEASKAGIMLTAGTDAGNPTMLPGQSLYRELSLLRKSGLDGYDVLAAATINAVRLFGEEAERGAITEGKIADIVLFDVNPVEEDTLERSNVVAVVKDGFLFDRARIAEEVARIRASYDEREAQYMKAALANHNEAESEDETASEEE